MKQEKIIFKNSKGQKLVGILYKPDNIETFPIAIFCHGYKGSRKNSSKIMPIANKLIAKNVGLFAFDFSGSGESEGKFEDKTITQSIDDLNSCIKLFKKPSRKIAVIGSSLGGLTALHTCLKNKLINGLVLISPTSHFPNKLKDEFAKPEKWKIKGYAYTYSKRLGKLKINYSFYEDGLNYQNFSVYKNIKIPVRIIQGDLDESIPLVNTKKLLNNLSNGKLLLINGVDHQYTNMKGHKKMTDLVSNFTLRILKCQT